MKIFIYIIQASLMAMMAMFAVSCSDSGGDEPENPIEDVDYSSTLSGLWMQTKVVYLYSESSDKDDETVNFDGEHYKYINIYAGDNDDDYTFERLSYPSLSVIGTYRGYTLEGSELYYEGDLKGSIIRCDGTNLVIRWEKSAGSFNLGTNCRTDAYYIRDTWSTL